MDLDIRKYGAGRTIRRKYEVVNWIGNTIDHGGWVLHKEFMEKDNPYRQGATLDDGLFRLQAHIKTAWLEAGGKELEPPDKANIKINK